MILVAQKSKASAQLQQKLGDIFDKSLLDIPLKHIFFQRDKIKEIGVFHRLQGKLTLRGGQTSFKICDF